LRKDTRIGIIVAIILLGLFALTLGFLIWQNTPFFDMRLVLLEVVILLVMAILFALVVMAPPDPQR
jgi:hypothetical protein